MCTIEKKIPLCVAQEGQIFSQWTYKFRLNFIIDAVKMQNLLFLLRIKPRSSPEKQIQ